MPLGLRTYTRLKYECGLLVSILSPLSIILPGFAALENRRLSVRQISVLDQTIFFVNYILGAADIFPTHQTARNILTK